jgi:hypothetical protein
MYKLFLESKKDLKNEILSKEGWVESSDIYPHWDWLLVYNMEGVNLNLLSRDKGKTICYYMGNMGKSEDDFLYVNSYNDNYTQLFSQYEHIYREMSDYDRMMKICKYVLPYFKNKPDDDAIDFIKECFLDISDICGDFEVEWGYDNGGDNLHFPAFKFSDKLSLRLSSEYYPSEDKWEEIKSEFELNKEKILHVFDIIDWQLNNYISIMNKPVRITIKSLF